MNSVFQVLVIWGMCVSSSVAEVMLSEVYFAQEENYTISDFIELHGPPFHSLDDYTVIIYAWTHQERKFPRKIFLNEKKISESGFFTIGEITAQNYTDAPILQHGEIKRGDLTLVTLYKNYVTPPFNSMKPTERNIVDCVAFGGASLTQSLSRWTPKVVPVKWQHTLEEESISRCGNTVLRNPFAFSLKTATPGRPNDCSDSEALITEVHLQADRGCFIELYSSQHDYNLSPYSLVIEGISNITLHHMTFDLWGMRTDHLGYFTLSSVYSLLDTESNYRALHCKTDLNVSNPLFLSLYKSYGPERDNLSNTRIESHVVLLPQTYGKLPLSGTLDNRTLAVVPGLQNLEFSVSWCNHSYLVTTTVSMAEDNNCTEAALWLQGEVTTAGTAEPITSTWEVTSAGNLSGFPDIENSTSETLPTIQSKKQHSGLLQSSHKLTNGDIIVIVVGGISGIALLVILLAVFTKCYRKRSRPFTEISFEDAGTAMNTEM